MCNAACSGLAGFNLRFQSVTSVRQAVAWGGLLALFFFGPVQTVKFTLLRLGRASVKQKQKQKQKRANDKVQVMKRMYRQWAQRGRQTSYSRLLGRRLPPGACLAELAGCLLTAPQL